MTGYTSILDRFFHHAEHRADAPAFDLPDGRSRSYADIASTVRRIAARLVADGVAPGDRVAMQVDKSPEAIALYLATQQIGAVFLPLNTAYTGAEVDYFLTDAEPAVLVCAPDRADDYRSRTAGLVVETLGTDGDGSLLAGSLPERTDVHAAARDEPAAILYTSGTTGRSKGAVLTQENLSSNCDALRELWQYSPTDRLIHALPIFHVHGLFVAANLTLTTGARMHFLPRFDTDAVIDLLPDSTVLMGVPTFYTRLLADARFTRERTESMRLFISGSAPLLAADHRAFAERTGQAILERYGMTETGMNTSNPYDGPRKPGTVGFPLPGVELRIVDAESGHPVADGETGIIEVRGPNVFAGYWQMPEKTAAEFRPDGFFITGDVARRDDDGYVCIVGREKDMVISGGFNVYPIEIEELLDAHPSVTESAVIGVPHPDLGEAVVAVVVPAPGQTPDAAELLASIGDRLARFKQPRAVRTVDALPRNVMGKVQKAQLRAQFAELFRTGDHTGD
ncbi:AMP-binding protein [Gordonia hydrophobica]|uniref:AMP-binding protein n=1 Tax=Gordonia hydrophobica TaxID=40516 RepID=A0ABZ2U102_9ACTN|nr:AMP-binding protein [Gordonia hydrophobica]MBM7368437.1 malonyl-CoA/methylmalonyl-CoA synthetase [Gordonia hydrophobica]